MENQELTRIRDLVRAGDPRGAEAAYLALQIPDDDADGLALRGIFALGRGQLGPARILLEQSLAAGPTVDAALNLAATAWAARDRRGAGQALATALDLAPESDEVLQLHRRIAPVGSLPESPRAANGGPAIRPTIWFCQPRSLLCDGFTPARQPLGGTESAMIFLAAALARRGHPVRVYCNCPAPGWFDGVEYCRWERARPDALRAAPDVLVAVRDWTLIGRNRWAPLQVFWTGDAADQPFARGLGEPADRSGIDLIAFQSAWQETGYQAAFGIPPWRCLRTRLGFAPFLQAEPDAARRPRRLIYTSTPFRGLDLLLDWFPQIRARCPDAELRVCSSMRVYGVEEAADRARFGALYDRARQPGVTLLGSLPQPELAAELRQARVLAYPNHWEETFCIAVVEAQAAGCTVVTSSLGALPETVGDGGMCLPGDPRTDPEFRRRFIEEVVAVLADDEQALRRQARARNRARGGYSWEAIALEWENWCSTALAGDLPEVQRLATHAGSGRSSLACRILEKEGLPGPIDALAASALRRVLAGRGDGGNTPGRGDFSQVARAFGPFRRLPEFDQWAAGANPLP
jgi:glycosyltransferase involved in cell wall biosynthesis